MYIAELVMLVKDLRRGVLHTTQTLQTLGGQPATLLDTIRTELVQNTPNREWVCE